MRNVWIICSKELRSYFVSPIGYFLLVMFAVIFGYFFWTDLFYVMQATMQAQMEGEPFPMDINEQVIRPLLSNMNVIALFFIPMITMRLFAEEKRSGTIELLVTSPVRDIEIILGKWLAAVTLYAAILGLSAINIALLFAYGKPDWKPILVGYLGLVLQGGALIAIGTFISTTTKNQIIAGGATFAVCLMLWVLDWVSSYEQAAWAKVVSYLSVVQHFEPFSKGVIDTKDLIFFASLMFFGLFLTARSMESLRWRA